MRSPAPAKCPEITTHARFVPELTRDKPKPHLEKQLVASIAREDGMVSAVEVREGDVPAKVEVAGEHVTVTALGCPRAGAKL